MKIFLLFFSILFFVNFSWAQSKWSWSMGGTPLLGSRFLVKSPKDSNPTFSTPSTIDSRNLMHTLGWGIKLDYIVERKLNDKFQLYSGASFQMFHLIDGKYVYGDFSWWNGIVYPNGYVQKQEGNVLYASVPIGFKYTLKQTEKNKWSLNLGLSTSVVCAGSGSYEIHYYGGEAHSYFKPIIFGVSSALQFEHRLNEKYQLSIYLPELYMDITPNAESYSVNQYHYYVGAKFGFGKRFGK